jgi:opacity protein-like surface antigen
MKRFAGVMFVAAVMALVVGSAQAQPYWNVWLEGGWSNSALNATSRLTETDQSHNGYLVGLQSQLRIYDEFAVGLGVRYTQKGGEGTIDSTFSTSTANVTEPIGSAVVDIDMIEIPITISYILDVGVNSWVRFYFGPSINIIINSHLTGVRSGQPIDEDIDDYIQDAEWAGMFGVSWNYDFDKWALLVDYRYVAGLSDLTASDEVKSQTHELAVGLGLRFGTYN